MYFSDHLIVSHSPSVDGGKRNRKGEMRGGRKKMSPLLGLIAKRDGGGDREEREKNPLLHCLPIRHAQSKKKC